MVLWGLQVRAPAPPPIPVSVVSGMGPDQQAALSHARGSGTALRPWQRSCRAVCTKDKLIKPAGNPLRSYRSQETEIATLFQWESIGSSTTARPTITYLGNWQDVAISQIVPTVQSVLDEKAIALQFINGGVDENGSLGRDGGGRRRDQER